MHIQRERRHFFLENLVLLYACFFVALWCFELCLVSSMLCSSHCIMLLCPSRILFLDAYTSCILHWSCVGHAFILMLLCFIGCMFAWSFALLYDHCSHFYMTVLVYGQDAHMFHIMFTWSQFTCYIIPVLLSLDLPRRSNVFCASVSGYRYICSKFHHSF